LIDDPPRSRALKKRGRGTYKTDKPPIITIVHRESTFTIFRIQKNLSKDIVNELITEIVNKEVILFTDEYKIYNKVSEHEKISEHLSINHSQKQYASGEIHVNNCENRHSLLRQFLRIFRGVSKRFLSGYILIYQYLFNYKVNAPDKMLKTILSHELS
jgi:transposase-like protein